MRAAVWMAGAAVLLVGCGMTTEATEFSGLDDLQTTEPRSLVEGGHGLPAVPPPQVDWALSLSGIASDDEPLPSRCYELEITLRDRMPDAAVGRVQLYLDGAELVDDTGRRYRPSRLQEIVPAEETKTPVAQRYVMIFDLPATYRFRSIGRVTVHWGLQVGGGPVQRVSSRFSR